MFFAIEGRQAGDSPEEIFTRPNKGPIEQLSDCELVFRRWLGDSWCCHCVGRQVGTCPSCQGSDLNFQEKRRWEEGGRVLRMPSCHLISAHCHYLFKAPPVTLWQGQDS